MSRFGLPTAAMCLAVAAASTLTLSAQKNDKDSKPEAQRPKLTLKAQPTYGITPTRVVLTAELTGGANDFEEYDCPTVRWEWGDDTSSESTLDCAPYEAAKTEIKRRFTVEHNFTRPGSYKIFVRLKRRDKEVASASTLVQLQAGAGDIRP